MTTIRLKDIMPMLTPQTAIGHRNLTLVPLRGEGHPRKLVPEPAPHGPQEEWQELAGLGRGPGGRKIDAR